MIGKDHVLTTQALSVGILALFNSEKHAKINIDAVGSIFNRFTLPDLLAGAIFIGVAGFASLIPDLDSASSTISKRIPFHIYKLTKHHAIFHSLIGWLIFSTVSFFLCLPLMLKHEFKLYATIVFFALIFGYLMHLVEDSFSNSGIIWNYPYGQIDQQTYRKYGAINRPVHHYRKWGGQKIPCRHFWGRGYRVGGKFEKKFAKAINKASILLLIWLIL